MDRDKNNTMLMFFGAIALIVIMLISTIISIVKISHTLSENKKNSQIEVVNEVQEDTNSNITNSENTNRSKMYGDE